MSKRYDFEKSNLSFQMLIWQGSPHQGILIQYTPESKYFQDFCKKRITIIASIGAEIHLIKWR